MKRYLWRLCIYMFIILIAVHFKYVWFIVCQVCFKKIIENRKSFLYYFPLLFSLHPESVHLVVIVFDGSLFPFQASFLLRLIKSGSYLCFVVLLFVFCTTSSLPSGTAVTSTLPWVPQSRNRYEAQISISWWNWGLSQIQALRLQDIWLRFCCCRLL